MGIQRLSCRRRSVELPFYAYASSYSLFVLVVPGVVCFAFCMYFALQDYAALQKTYAQFARLAGSSTDMSVLFVAESRQNIHRINVFADVVWALLGAIVAAIGIHGLYVNRQRQG